MEQFDIRAVFGQISHCVGVTLHLVVRIVAGNRVLQHRIAKNQLQISCLAGANTDLDGFVRVEYLFGRFVGDHALKKANFEEQTSRRKKYINGYPSTIFRSDLELLVEKRYFVGLWSEKIIGEFAALEKCQRAKFGRFRAEERKHNNKKRSQTWHGALFTNSLRVENVKCAHMVVLKCLPQRRSNPCRHFSPYSTISLRFKSYLQRNMTQF